MRSVGKERRRFIRFQKSGTFLVVVGILLSWATMTTFLHVPETFLPGPGAVARSLVDLFGAQGFLHDVGASIYRVMAGYQLAAFLGVPLGVWMGQSKRAAWLVEPILAFLRYLPVPAFIPLCILWIGIGNSQKIAVIFLGTFFQLTILVADAARAIPATYIDLARCHGLSSWQRLIHVVFPATLPGVYDALRVCMGWAWSYVVVAEFVAASSGIGHVVIESQRYLKTSEVFAAILTIGLIGLAFDQSFLRMKGVFFPWTVRQN